MPEVRGAEQCNFCGDVFVLINTECVLTYALGSRKYLCARFCHYYTGRGGNGSFVYKQK